MKKTIVAILSVLCLVNFAVIFYRERAPEPMPMGTQVAQSGPGAGQSAPFSPNPPGPNPLAQRLPVLRPGQEAPDFTLTSTTGETIHLAELLNKGPVLLCFYKLECQTSGMALPKFETFHDAYAGKGTFSIIGIVQNPAQQVAESVSYRGLRFPHAEDVGYEVSRKYGIRNTPTLVLVGTDGRLAARVGGWNRKQTNQISETIAKAVGAQYQAISQPGDGVPADRPG